LKILSMFSGVLIAGAASACVVHPGASRSSNVGPGSAPPPPSACAEELGADASDDFAVAPQVSTMQQPDRRFTGCLAPGDKADVFAILVPEPSAGRVYRIAVTGRDDNATRAEVFDGDRRQLTYANANDPGGATLWVAAAGNSALYVAVRSPHVRNARPYEIAISSTPLQDADEPNDDRDRPTPLGLGQPHEALGYAAANATDRALDAYRVELKRPGTLHIVVDNVPSEVGVRVELFDADGRRLHGESSRNDGATVRAESKKLGAGTYLVTVGSSGRWDVAGHGEPPHRLSRPYRVTVTAD